MANSGIVTGTPCPYPYVPSDWTTGATYAADTHQAANGTATANVTDCTRTFASLQDPARLILDMSLCLGFATSLCIFSYRLRMLLLHARRPFQKWHGYVYIVMCISNILSILTISGLCDRGYISFALFDWANMSVAACHLLLALWVADLFIISADAHLGAKKGIPRPLLLFANISTVLHFELFVIVRILDLKHGGIWYFVQHVGTAFLLPAYALILYFSLNKFIASFKQLSTRNSSGSNDSGNTYALPTLLTNLTPDCR